jgi:hypothetical protein
VGRSSLASSAILIGPRKCRKIGLGTEADRAIFPFTSH